MLPPGAESEPRPEKASTTSDQAHPPSPKSVLVQVILAFVGALVGGGVAAGLFGVVAAVAAGGAEAGEKLDLNSAPALTFGLLGINIVLVVLTLAFVGARAEPAWQGLGLASSRIGPVGLVSVIVGALAVSSASMFVLQIIFGGAGTALDGISESGRNASLGWWVAQSFMIALAAPVAEELFCRGFAQRTLRKAMGPVPAILIASSLFALMHLDKVQSLLALVIGLYLGWLTESTKSLRPAILAHVSINGISVIVGRMAPTEEKWIPTLDASVAIAIGILVLVAAGNLFYQRRWLRQLGRSDGIENVIHDAAE